MNENMVTVTRDEWEALVELRARVSILSRIYGTKKYIDKEELAYIFGFEKEAE